MIKKIFITVLAALFLAELLVRLYFIQTSPLPQKIIKQSFYTSLKKFVPNSQGEQDGIFYKINSLGFRGKEPKKTRGLSRIIILGDSTSFGLGIEEDKTYSALLEKKLNAWSKSEKNFEVINASAPGLGTAAEFDIFQNRLKRLSPKLVILAFFPNDLIDNQVYLREKAMLLDNSLRGKFKKLLYWRTKLKSYQLVANFIAPLFYQKDDLGDWTLSSISGKGITEESLLQERNFILQFKKETEAVGGRLLLLYLPTQLELNQASFINDWLKSFCLKEKVFLLDMGGVYEKRGSEENFYLPNDLGHPGELGHEIIAEEIKNFLIDQEIF